MLAKRNLFLDITALVDRFAERGNMASTICLARSGSLSNYPISCEWINAGRSFLNKTS
ncbi:hypothetical protein J27TS7_31620 [Paenibacillus dendritiformis]|nr:hypothetical protein J27TS7_31620 [Paenibacillus dendritiformis]